MKVFTLFPSFDRIKDIENLPQNDQNSMQKVKRSRNDTIWNSLKIKANESAVFAQIYRTPYEFSISLQLLREEGGRSENLKYQWKESKW